MAEELEQRVTKVIAEQFGIPTDTVTPTASLRDDLGADSLDDIELVMALEDEFSIEIPDWDAQKCKTVQDMFDLIARFHA